ncbi:MAG: undecaprenyldiphospho-muramoylpentapeptide beta-N-acetylglucosaminyltransferase [Coriobacteriia bacterium]|nr:undecaprenyldiphospho-muramoylpentapeptide beta-N-acetylglucosaminyltransferase [Coriobacteriia bacterium]
MRVLLSGGGTAGHIYPALTVADRLRADGHEVRVIGTPNGPEARLAREAGLAFDSISARGFDRSRPLSLLVALLQLVSSAARSWFLLGRLRPRVVVGFGGYVSLPVGVAAILWRIPLVLHEQNSVPGMANRALSLWACAVGVTYEGSVRYLKPGTRAEVTGNPVREAILRADRESGRVSLDLPADAVVVLVFGGSRGARHINEAVVDLRGRLLADDRVHVLHVAGREEAPTVRECLERSGGDGGGRYRIIDYIEDMGSAIAAADVVVARAGATSIAEITAIGRAAILVPYPYATEDHQTLNAREVEEGGGALLIADSDLDTDAFAEALESLLADAARRGSMSAASRRLGVPDAAVRLERLILGCVHDRKDGDNA